MKQACNGIVYATETALLIARNEHAYCIESIVEGRTDKDLYRTLGGAYFTATVTRSEFDEQVSDPELTPLSIDEAIATYNTMTDRRLDFEDAFPV